MHSLFSAFGDPYYSRYEYLTLFLLSSFRVNQILFHLLFVNINYL